MVTHNEISFALIKGDTDFAIGDKFGYGDDHLGFLIEAPNGVIQRFMGRCFAAQLPSAAEPTIADPTW